jgi:hypothetical protein
VLIRLKKLDGGVVLALLRDGASTAVQRTGHNGFFALHDLMHYAVETTLKYDRAFFGLMASGWSFENFTRRDDPNYRTIPDEAIVVEHLVGTMTRHHRDASARDGDSLAILADDINADLAASLSQTGVAPPALASARIRSIYDRFDRLAGEWTAIPVGGLMELAFPAARADD